MRQEAGTLQLAAGRRWLVLVSIIAMRIVYSLNWFNISPALSLIAQDLRVDLPALGVLTSSFLLGAGIFQVPAGILAARWGPRNSALLGMVILSLSAIGEGLSTSLAMIAASRFMLGLGAAFFFAPAIGVLTPLFKEEEKGLVIGLYNGAFNIGGGLGLFAWVLVIQALDWRAGLVLGGIAGLVVTMIGRLIVPKDIVQQGQAGAMRTAVKNRNVWLIALGVIGLWGGVFTTSQFLNLYLVTELAIPATVGGLMASLIMFSSIIGAPMGGHLSDRFRQRKIFILVPGLGASVGLALIGLSQQGGLWSNALWILIPMIGFLDAMVFSTMYASASQYPEVGHRYAPLAISMINSAHILGSFGIPITFTLIASAYDYSAGWYFLGGLAVALMLMILWLKEPFKANSKALG